MKARNSLSCVLAGYILPALGIFLKAGPNASQYTIPVIIFY